MVVIGAGHNGLVCGCYLARAGLQVAVVEAAVEPGGCIHTVDLPGGTGRLELGAYEHGGLRTVGWLPTWTWRRGAGCGSTCVTSSFLRRATTARRWRSTDSRERTVDGLRVTVGNGDADAYDRFARWAQGATGLLAGIEAGPPPSLRQLAALAEATLGAQAPRLLQALLGSASTLLRGSFTDQRLQGVLAHWAAHSQQPPTDPGTGLGALLLAGGHGVPAARPMGGSRATVEALVRCLQAAGGTLRCGHPAERVEVAGGRAVAVHAAGERFEAARAVVSAVDARRLFLGLLDERDVPGWLQEEVRRIHVGRANVSELKVDAVLAGRPAVPGPAGYERSFLLSANTITDLERAFASIRLGDLPQRPPLMIAFPSAFEPGWAPRGQDTVWLSTFVPWQLDSGPWTPQALDRAAEHAWTIAERALGVTLRPAERRVTGPQEWVARTGNPHANPNHVEMSVDQLLGFRPSPSLAHYRTPIAALYLTGAGTHPGGGITGIPGRNTASVILDTLGLHRRHPSQRLRDTAARLLDAARAIRTLRTHR